MSRLEEIRESIKQLNEICATNTVDDIEYTTNWILHDISVTLAMIYDKMCEERVITPEKFINDGLRSQLNVYPRSMNETSEE